MWINQENCELTNKYHDLTNEKGDLTNKNVWFNWQKCGVMEIWEIMGKYGVGIFFGNLT